MNKMTKRIWCNHYEYLPFVESDLLEECLYCVENKKIGENENKTILER